ncbi:hypothetical protein V491_00542 [Pseudogymnoascus sp. VKM F-3775]|nr:hypothetical protein V491_00542 [Pseudogymnoascus sp. VKM F-3775]
MQFTYLIQALFIAVAVAAPAPRGDDIPAGIFPSGHWPTGSSGPTGGPAPTSTDILWPTGTGGGHHHHNGTHTGGPAPTGTGGGHHHHTTILTSTLTSTLTRTRTRTHTGGETEHTGGPTSP